MDGMDMTDDEGIFEALGRAFADALPSVYKADTCGSGFHSGIVHGAQLKGDSNAIMLDEVYNKYHSLMVGEGFDQPSLFWKNSDVNLGFHQKL